MLEEDNATAIDRLEVYRLHSRALPEPDSRRVLVYLPPQYAEDAAMRFPVFYLHDGQNLFDPKTSYLPGRTWRAHETADRLARAGEMEPAILVGIANTGVRRMAEYTPTHDSRLGGGEGGQYSRLLTNELKPLVDATYRTRSGPLDTAVGGSSLGGLISLYLALQQPSVFGNAAVLSPSLWWDRRSVLALVERVATQWQAERKTARPKLWLDIGSAEGEHHLRDTGMLHRLLLRKGWRDNIDVEYFVAEGAIHMEDAWAERFDRILRFLFPAMNANERQPAG